MSDLLRQAQTLEHAAAWSGLTVEAKRRRALQAANSKDLDELMSLVEAFATLFSGTMTSHTKASYRRGVTLLCEAGYNLIRVTPDEAALFVRRLELPYARATVSSYRSAVKLLYDALIWADAYRDEDKGRTLANPFGGVRIRKDNTAAEDRFGSYSDKDLQLLLPCTTPETRVLLFLGAHGGLRVSEMVALGWADVDLRNSLLWVRKGKGDKRRKVPLTQTLCATLTEARAYKPLPYPDRFAASYALEKVCKQAGVNFQGKALHGLRHYAGTKAYQATKDLLRVGRLLGHSSVETTARYAKTLLSGFDDSFLDEFKAILK